MKNFRQIIFTLLLLIPLSAFASGQQIIIVGFFELILISIFIIILWNLKLNLQGKLIITLIYILSTILTLYFVNTGAYFEKLLVTNASIAIIPSVAILLTYLILKKKFKKIN